MDYPTMIQLESSTACDARCTFCPHSKMQRKRGTMKDDLFERILSEAGEMGIQEVLLFLNGEPLIFPRLPQWLQCLRDTERTTTIFTNANALTEDKAKMLLSFSDVIGTIVFSLGGMDAETYQKVMGIPYYVVRRNVERFYLLNDGIIPMKAHIPCSSETQPFIAQWLDTWAEFFGDLSPTAMFNFAGLISDPLELKEDERHSKKYCGRLNHLAILWDGRVCLCCMDTEGQVILGDANNKRLIDIFNSDTARKYREYHKEERFAELPLCRDCNMNILHNGSILVLNNKEKR